MKTSEETVTFFSHQKIYQAWWILMNEVIGRLRARLLLVITLFFSVSLGLTACGFHLKGYNGGEAVATFASAKLEADGTRREVHMALERYLKESDVKVVDNLGDAEIVIRLGPTGYHTSPTSKDANGNTSSELIKMTQGFSVEQVASERKVIQTTVNTFRNRTVDPNQAQASHRELKSIEKQMAFELASQILDRINRAYTQTPTTESMGKQTSQTP